MYICLFSRGWNFISLPKLSHNRKKKNALLSWLILKPCQSRGSANLASDFDIEIQKLDEPELEPEESEMRHRHRV